MSAGEVLRYAAAIGIACVAVLLVINGVRNTLYAWTLARHKHLQNQLDALMAAVETQQETQRITTEQLAALHARCDSLATRQTALRLVTMTAEERDHAYKRLISDLQKLDEPGDAQSPGSVTNAPPPAPPKKEGMRDQ